MGRHTYQLLQYTDTPVSFFNGQTHLSATSMDSHTCQLLQYTDTPVSINRPYNKKHYISYFNRQTHLSGYTGPASDKNHYNATSIDRHTCQLLHYTDTLVSINLDRTLTEAGSNDDMITELEFTEALSGLSKDTAPGPRKLRNRTGSQGLVS